MANALTRGMGWGACFEPAEEGGIKPSLNAGSLAFKGR